MGHGGADMSDLRLEEIPFDFNGKTYLLRCNMNVLADVQEVYGGQIGEAMTGNQPTKSVLEFLTAMLNDYAEDMGWPEHYTSREVGRKLSPNAARALDIMGLVTRALAPPKPVSGADTAEEDADPGDSGN